MIKLYMNYILYMVREVSFSGTLKNIDYGPAVSVSWDVCGNAQTQAPTRLSDFESAFLFLIN